MSKNKTKKPPEESYKVSITADYDTPKTAYMVRAEFGLTTHLYKTEDNGELIVAFDKAIEMLQEERIVQMKKEGRYIYAPNKKPEEQLYELLQDFTDPNGTVRKGARKTNRQWLARFALLTQTDLDIKTDWFKKVNKVYHCNNCNHPIIEKIDDTYVINAHPDIDKKELLKDLKEIGITIGANIHKRKYSKEELGPKKPPLGITPPYFWRQERKEELLQAITRYDKAGLKFPKEWVKELCELNLLENGIVGLLRDCISETWGENFIDTQKQFDKFLERKGLEEKPQNIHEEDFEEYPYHGICGNYEKKLNPYLLCESCERFGVKFLSHEIPEELYKFIKPRF